MTAQGGDSLAHMQTMAMLGHMYNMMANMNANMMKMQLQSAGGLHEGSKRISVGEKRQQRDALDERRPRTHRRIMDGRSDDIGIAKEDFKDLNGKCFKSSPLYCKPWHLNKYPLWTC